MVELLRKHAGNLAEPLSTLWRQKQLEYSFRRGLMRAYRDFRVCTSSALDYACLTFSVSLSEDERNMLLEAYRKLPAFGDVSAGLKQAQEAGLRLFAFSNGTASDVGQLLDNAGISGFFLDIISVDELHSFKPDPSVYHHFLSRANAKGKDAWMVSANPFDVIGAAAAGMQSLWVQRSRELIMDPWESGPNLTISSLAEVAHVIAGWRNNQQQNP